MGNPGNRSIARAFARRYSSIALAALIAVPAVALAASPAAAVTFTAYAVNSTADATDAAGSGLCATQPPTTATPCTLRAAIAEANALTGVTINVPAGTLTLSAGALTISKPMTITGAEKQPGTGATTIDGAAKDRVFSITATGVTIDGVVVRNGFPSRGDGGGILVNKNANLTLKKSTVSGNKAANGAGVEVDGTATISQSTFQGNTASSKGGGLYNAATATVQNSTFDGNSANGGGGIVSPGTTNVVASTVTNNNSNNSNGGGLYRNGGTFNVTGSIVAANNGGSGRDCYGSPNFIGTNILQYTPGCNPTGNAVLVTDPQLAALGDNGGATQTRRPLPGSPALNAYANPCATTVDQRDIARPQPTGGRCDVGAVENVALGLDLTLQSNVESIGVGARNVPNANIPPSALLPTSTSGSSTHSTVVKWTVVKWTVVKWTVVKWTVVKWTVVKWTVVKWTVVKWTDAEAILNAAGIPDPLKSIHLSDVTLDRPGGWDALLLGSSYENVAREQITLADAMPLIESAGVTVDQLDLSDTPLGSIPYMSLLLGGVAMKKIPLSPALETATDQQRLGAWCTALTTPAQNPCAALAVDPNAATPSSITPLAVSLAGFSFDSMNLNSILTKNVVPNDADWFKAMSFANFAHQETAMSSLPLSSLPASWIDCTKLPAGSTCGTTTLRQAANYDGAINPSITLYDVFTNPTTLALPPVAAFTLGDLLQGIVPPEAMPWQNLDLTNTSLQNASDPKEPALTYALSVNIKGDRNANTSVQLTLPAGFALAPGSFKIDGAAAADPSVDANNVATLTLGSLTPGLHTVTIDARAGLTLGPATATAAGTATAGSDTATASASKTVTVVESFEAAGTAGCGDLDPCDTKPLDPNSLYIGHISSATDRDLYKFTVPATAGKKTRASLILSNLPADFDMVLFGPQSPQVGANPPQKRSFEPVNDSQLSLYPNDAHLSPDTANDVPLTPPSDGSAPGVIQVAANRGTVEERIDTGTLRPGTYTIEVSGYNGAFSSLPYALRLTLPGFTPPQCATTTRAFADGGPLAASTTLGSNPHVLFVVPQHRLYQTYGASRVDPLIAKVQAIASQVGGTILAVDNPGTATASAYAAWDQNHCEADAANAVVHAVATQIRDARDANPLIDAVVLVGDDSVLPMARVPDRTRIANEGNYADALQSIISTPNGPQSADNELSGSLEDGYLLTDNAYGTRAGVSVDDHEMFNPDIALGRLVETPEDIVAAIATFLDNNGTLDASTATSALVTGYDFMTDAAQAVDSALTANGRNVDDSLINDSWHGSDLTDKLLGGSAPGIVSLNGHFDQTRLLAGNGSDLVHSSVLSDPANAAKLARRLIFSMGCHSGLSVSDISVGTEFDWPQAFTGKKQGATYAGNTGFGYGDDSALALGERLVALYAQALDGSVSVGEALMLAKQQYVATTEILSPYDEKVVQESVFYGLPIYQLSSAIPTSNATLHALTMSAPTGGSSTTISGTDPRTGLPVAPISVPVNTDTGLTLKTTGRGSYYEVNGEKIMVQYRPIEPRTSLKATQAGQRAHGVLITGLSTNDTPGFSPKYFRPIVDSKATEQFAAPIGDSVFPSTLASVTHPVGANGSEDLVLLTAGQARDPQNDGTGKVTQRIFTKIDGVVEYVPPANNDYVGSTLFRSRGEIVGTTAGFVVDTDASALRTYVLYKATGTNGAWKGVDLSPTNLPDGTKRWFGGGPIVGNSAEFFVQAVDASGNVTVSNNKVSNFLATRLTNNGLTITVTPPAGVTPVNGWYSTTQTITAFVNGGTGITYSLDGAEFAAYSSSGVPISGNGVHHVIALDSANNIAVVDVLIDASAPNVTAAVDAGTSNATTDASNNIWYDGPVSLNITANDGVIGSGVASIAYHAGNAPDVVVTDASNPALDRSPLGTASTTVGVNGTNTYTYKGTDVAGNASANGSTTIRIDGAAPSPNCSVPSTSPWYMANVSVTCHPTDTGVGLASAADATVVLSTTVPQGSQTSTASTGSHQVCDRLNHCITIGPFVFKVDEQAPTIAGTVQPGSSTSAQDASHNVWYGGPVNLHLVGDDGSDGSDIDSITYASSGAFVLPSTTVHSATADVNVSPASDGGSTVTYSSRDVAGNNSATGSTGIAIDTAAPTVSCTLPNQSQWYLDNVTVNCNATDNGVGLAVGTPSIFTLSTSVAPLAQSSTAPTSTQQVCDRLAHCVTVGTTFTFKVDRKAPTVSITSPAGGAVFNPGQSVAAAYSCSDGTGGSGVPTSNCVGPVANGAAIDTSPGTHVFAVTATDVAGNVTNASVTYSVGYRICYLYDTTKAQSLGGTVVLKVQLCDASGNNLSSANITLTAVAQDFPGPNPPRQLPSPNFQGNSNNGFDFRYSAGSYIYNLDPTQPLPNGTMLGSGSHTLYFVVNHVEPPLYTAPFVLK